MPGTVALTNVSKRFIICHEKARSFQETLVQMVRRRNGTKEEFWALRDVSFQVERGQTLGLIGRNGSGKSTALKLMTRILSPTAGTVRVDGRISALIELGTGFHPDLTGRENIYLNGSILGFTRKEMDKRLDQIVAFSELDRFIDTPVKHYSSGMYARLGFSVATSVDPEILVIDEVLAVGDEAFQRKCLARIHDFKRLGKTILFVSHNLNDVQEMCDRVVWLDAGRVRAQGAAAQVVNDYRESVDAGGAARDPAPVHRVDVPTPVVELSSAPRCTVTGVALVDADGRPLPIVVPGAPARVRIDCTLVGDYGRERLGLRLSRADGLNVQWSECRLADAVCETGPGQGAAIVEFPSLPLGPGFYKLNSGFWLEGVEEGWRSDERALCRFAIDGQSTQSGLLELPHRWLNAQEAGVLTASREHVII
ncbi:MAG: polysaccharide ABC transporter ATP-binding protein [Chloroflexi bacterium]|nr:polysaccharide ABC transporter ATP-binding protein [Chloroflexota bacterium]